MRSTTAAFGALLLGSTFVASCSAPPPLKINDTPPPGSATAGATAPAAFDVSPVPAPSGIVAKIRARDLGATLRVGGALVGAPAGGADGVATALLAELLAGKRGLRLDVSGPELAREIELAAPVDIVVALESDRNGVSFAFSLGLKSLDGARSAAGSSVVETGPGVFAIGGEKAKGVCSIMASAGPTSARLVCGTRDEDVAALGPYLARTLSIEPAASQDIVADIDVSAINARFGDELKKVLPALPNLAKRRYGIGNATFDKAFEGGANFVVNDLSAILADVKGMHLEAAVNEATGIDVRSRIDVASAPKSWLVKTALATPSGAVPAIFWKGPVDTDGAWFGSFGEPSGYAELIKAAKGMVIGTLEKDKVGSDAERKKVAALLDLPIVKGTTLVAFGGSAKTHKPAPAKTTKEKWQQGFDQLMGWYVVGLSQKADPWAKWMKDAASAFNQPGMQKGLRSVLGQNDTLTLKTAAAPKQLGKGATGLELGFSSKSDKTEGVLSLFVMPDGDNTWLAAGFDKDELVERLLRAKDGKGALKDRSELAALKNESVSAAAFMSLRSFRSSAFSLLLMSDRNDDKAPKTPEDAMLDGIQRADAIFDGLPGKGRTPFFMKTSGTASSVGFQFTLGKPVLEDVKALVKSLQR